MTPTFPRVVPISKVEWYVGTYVQSMYVPIYVYVCMYASTMYFVDITQ